MSKTRIGKIALFALVLTVAVGLCAFAFAEEHTTDHVWGSWSSFTAATCRDAAVEVRQCSICGKLDFRSVGAPDLTKHTWTEWYSYIAPECEVDGTERRDCTTCGTYQDRTVSKIGHNYQLESITPATCTEPGSYNYQCMNDPHHTKTETIPPLGHDWGEWTVTKAPTCTEGGTETRVCKRDPSHKEERSVDPHGHNYVGKVTKEPTCLDPGTRTYTCTYDPTHTYTEPIPPLDHDWGEWTVTKQPTCLTKGEETRICKRDPSHKETRELPALDHDWGEWTVTKQPTCLDKGVETRLCKRDPSHKQTRDVAPVGHDWGDWTYVPGKEPACTEPGQEQRICKRDPSHRETRAVGPLGHDWGPWKPVDAMTEERICKRDPEHKETRFRERDGTVCAFGLRLRDTASKLRPYSSDRWYMYTPFDASYDHTEYYELVADNLFIVGGTNHVVGGATVTVQDGEIKVDYTITARRFNVTLEFFTILNQMSDLNGTFEPEALVNRFGLQTNTWYSIEEKFGGDTNLVLYFCSRCHYTPDQATYNYLRYETTQHQRDVRDMLAMMD